MPVGKPPLAAVRLFCSPLEREELPVKKNIIGSESRGVHEGVKKRSCSQAKNSHSEGKGGGGCVGRG
ncbi:hypothetical protein E2C01_067348 [Portunus trituberculatus]|uniref:Uncharacterized protein n=1 Tax=Portunus trituberculatus TaxID=210409 RepID=A0A5B7HNV7_PORTR|nr:hypothetical protein [Portunus trituberculatus]